MGLAWDMRYNLCYPAAFALGIVTLLALTEGQLAITDLDPGQAPTGKQSWAHEHISVSPALFTAAYMRRFILLEVEKSFAGGVSFLFFLIRLQYSVKAPAGELNYKVGVKPECWMPMYRVASAMAFLKPLCAKDLLVLAHTYIHVTLRFSFYEPFLHQDSKQLSTLPTMTFKCLLIAAQT